LSLRVLFSEIASLRSVHDDMSAKPCDNYKMIMVKYADLLLVYSHVGCPLDSARLELRELKACFILLGACTNYLLLKSDLEDSAFEIKDLKHKLDHSSHYNVLSPPCDVCGSLKGQLFHVTKENTELKQEVAYLTARLQKTVLSVKMIEEDLSRVEESATNFTYKLEVGFGRYEKKDEKSAPNFVPSSSYHKEEEALKPTKTHYPSNPKSSFNSKREVRKETPKLRVEAFICMFCDRASHLDEFCFRRKKIERCFEYAGNSYRNEFFEFPPRSYSRALPRTSSRTFPQFSHGPHHHSYSFGSRENRFEPRHFGYSPHPHCGDCFLCRPGFPTGASHTHSEPRPLDGPHFPCRGSCPTGSSGEMLRTVKISSGRMVKC
jgi:hypothetical protein